MRRRPASRAHAQATLVGSIVASVAPRLRSYRPARIGRQRDDYLVQIADNARWRGNGPILPCHRVFVVVATIKVTPASAQTMRFLLGFEW